MKNRITPENIQNLKENEIFVFGSNIQGRHIGGAARLALDEFGAILGKGIGLQGKSYAIPTLDYDSKEVQLPLQLLQGHISSFIKFASIRQDKTFLVTEIGCGIAGFTPEEIAPMFRQAAEYTNIILPNRFWDILNK